jgi:hypothetical protein
MPMVILMVPVVIELAMIQAVHADGDPDGAGGASSADKSAHAQNQPFLANSAGVAPTVHRLSLLAQILRVAYSVPLILLI